MRDVVHTGSMAPAVLLCILAVVLAAPTAVAQPQQQRLSQWDVCGGLNSPSKSDAAVTGCPPGFACIRQDEFYWQCKDIKTLQGNAAELAKQPEKQGQQLGAPGLPQEAQGKQTQVQTAGGAEVVKPWGQCGGITNNPAGTDIVWPNVTCPPGYECVRQDGWFYNCKSIASLQLPAEASPRPTTPLVANETSATGEKPKTAEQPPVQAKPAVEAKPPAEAKPIAEQKPPVEVKPTAEQKPPAEAKPTAERTPPAEAKPAAEQKPPTDAKPAAEDKAPAEAKPAAVEKPAAKAPQEPEPAPAPAPTPASAAGAGPVPEPVKLALQFPGVTTDEFKAKYAEGSLKAVAEVAGVDPAAVKSTVTPAGAGGAAARRLLASGGVDVAYTITAADRDALLERLDTASADGGAGLNKALAAAGVPLKPAVWIDGQNKVPVAPVVTPRTAETPAATVPAPEQATGTPAVSQSVVIGAVVGSVLGALLLVALVLVFLRLRRRKAAAGQDASLPVKPTKQATPDVEMASGSDKAAQSGRPTTAVTAAAAGHSSQTLQSAAAAGAAAAAALPALQHSSSGRAPSASLAPAEAFPRSFNPTAEDTTPSPVPALPPVRTSKEPAAAKVAAPAAAAAAGVAAAAAAAVAPTVALPAAPAAAPAPAEAPVTPSSSAAAAAHEDLPPTPGSRPGSDGTFRSGDEAFGTPRSTAGGAPSEVSFKSAGAGSGSEASFRTVGGASAASFASARSAASRMSAVSAATSFSKHENASEFPKAFVPRIPDEGSASGSDAEGDAPLAARGSGGAAAGPSAAGARGTTSASRLAGSRLSGSGKDSAGKRSFKPLGR